MTSHPSREPNNGEWGSHAKHRQEQADGNRKALHHFEGKPTAFIVTSQKEVLSNSVDVHHLCSSQEEADTMLILCVFVLASNSLLPSALQKPLLRHCSGEQEESIPLIPLEPVVDALSSAKAEALPGLHAFSRADVTGCFPGKGKLTYWQALSRCSMR